MYFYVQLCTRRGTFFERSQTESNSAPAPAFRYIQEQFKFSIVTSLEKCISTRTNSNLDIVCMSKFLISKLTFDLTLEFNYFFSIPTYRTRSRVAKRLLRHKKGHLSGTKKGHLSGTKKVISLAQKRSSLWHKKGHLSGTKKGHLSGGHRKPECRQMQLLQGRVPFIFVVSGLSILFWRKMNLLPGIQAYYLPRFCCCFQAFEWSFRPQSCMLFFYPPHCLMAGIIIFLIQVLLKPCTLKGCSI